MTRALGQAAYESTFRTVQAALRSADPLAVAVLALRHVQGSVDGFRQLSGVEVACRAGCSFCCWLRIDVRAHEVLAIRRFLEGDAVAHLRESLGQAVRQAGGRVAGLAHGDRQAVRQPCGLLDHAGCCSVYAVRPAACRRYFSIAVDACEAIWDGREPSVEPEVPAVAEAGRFAANGVHNAFIAEGYDGYSYDLMAALAEAMDDPECEARWRLKQAVFSVAARSSVPEGFSQDAALAKLREELAHHPSA